MVLNEKIEGFEDMSCFGAGAFEIGAGGSCTIGLKFG